MTNIFCRIDRLGHGADTELFQHMLLRLTPYIGQHLVKGLGNGLGGLEIEGMAVFFGEVDEREQLLLVRRIMYPVRKRNGFFVDLDLANGLGNGTVGQQHELLDQLMGLLAFFDHDADGLALRVQLKSYFCRRKVDSPFLKTCFAETLSQLIQRSYFCQVKTGLLLDDLLHFLVSKAMVRMDHRPAQPCILDFAFGGHAEDGGKGELVLMRPQGTQFIGYPFRQHGIDPVREVDGSGTGIGLFIESSLRFDIIADVGDVYADLQLTMVQRADRNGIVKIFGVDRVDGESQNIADIFPFGDLRCRDEVRQPLGIFQDIFREKDREAILQ